MGVGKERGKEGGLEAGREGEREGWRQGGRVPENTMWLCGMYDTLGPGLST